METTRDFGTFNPNAELFKQIKKQKPNWWNIFREDKELYIDIRKDNYINVYYFGGALANIGYKENFVATIHKKYLDVSGENYVSLNLQQLSKEKIAEIKNNIKKHYLDRGNPEKPAEKKIQGKLILENSNYIDSEFAYNKDIEIGKLRIDLIELSNGILSFVELKIITDNRLRNDEKRNKKTPEIIEQMNKYQQFINKYEDKIIDYYKCLIQLKNDLGLSNQSTNFTLNKTPKLIIANTYNKSTTGREKRIAAIKTLLNKHKIDYKIV